MLSDGLHLLYPKIPMQSFDLKTYFLYALYIVRTNPLILLFVAAVGLLNSLSVYFPEGGLAGIVGTLTIVSAIFISPLIYGIYYEIIEEKNNPLVTIFRTYVPGYLLLLFCMYIPIILTTTLLISSTQATAGTATVMLTILVFSLLLIYVVPAYYVSGKIIESIIYGLRFFLSNALSSAPLLLMALMSELLLLLAHFKFGGLRQESPILFVGLDFSVYMAASIIDFLLFIMLIYILRNQDLPKR